MGEKIVGLSRREFLRFCAAVAAMLGLSENYVPQIARALTAASKKPPLIWLNGQSCTGCTISTLNSGHPSAAEIVLDVLSVRFLETVMAASGEQALKVLDETIEQAQGQYFLVVEGSVPAKDNRFCLIGEADGQPIPFAEWVKKAAAGAKGVIAVGACAAHGGIPAAGFTEGTGIGGYLDQKVIKLPGCPPHPDWVVGTVVSLLTFGLKKTLAGLDGFGRPEVFYGQLIHDNCPRRHWFEAGMFIENWNDPAQTEYCLLKKGCKGPVTYADCPKRGWNSSVNWCIKAGAPCVGCASLDFYQKLSPLYQQSPDIKLPYASQATADQIGKWAGVAAAAGIGLHLIGQIATGRLGKSGRRKRGER